jgi:hypothetical protein
MKRKPKRFTLKEKKRWSDRYGPRWEERYQARRLAEEFAQMQERKNERPTADDSQAVL